VQYGCSMDAQLVCVVATLLCLLGGWRWLLVFVWPSVRAAAGAAEGISVELSV
jgi:hypothetical protein